MEVCKLSVEVFALLTKFLNVYFFHFVLLIGQKGLRWLVGKLRGLAAIKG